MRKCRGWLLFVSSLIFTASLNAGAIDYSVEGLGSFIPTGINSSGQMSGITGSTSYFKDVGLSPQVLPQPYGMGRNWAESLNDSGAAVGYTGSGGDKAVLWKSDHTFVNLGSLNGECRANDINNAGTVVGEGYNGPSGYGWIWTESGGMRYLPPRSGYNIIRPRAINDAGQIVGCIGNAGAGSRAFLWQADGTTVYLSSPSQGVSVTAEAINNLGQVVGSADGTAWFWSLTTGMVSLPTLSGATYTTARSINSSGWIVGSARIGTNSHAIIWSPDHQVYELPSFEGRQTSWAHDINDAGQVIGSAFYTSGDMLEVGLLWTPVPEPSSVIGLACGLLGLVGLRRRKA